MDENKARISAYLARFFPGHALQENENIFTLGFVTSMFALQLVNFLEHEFKLTIENEDLELDNFQSISALVRLVERKSAPVAS